MSKRINLLKPREIEVCIFAYGQTGSGKTFTMTGTDANPGVGWVQQKLLTALNGGDKGILWKCFFFGWDLLEEGVS